MRNFIIWFSIVGTVFFTSALILSYVSPNLIESAARNLILHEVEKRISVKLDSLKDAKVTKVIERFTAGHLDKIAELKKEMPQLLPVVVAQMSDPTCECRKLFDSAATKQYDGKASRVGQILYGLSMQIRAKYIEVADALTREFRIFTGANAVVFTLLGLTAYLRPNAGLKLILPAIVLIGAATIVGGFFLFGQDWIHTIVYSDYVGFGYFSYLGLAVTFMTDVFYNRGRVSAEIINAVARALNSFQG